MQRPRLSRSVGTLLGCVGACSMLVAACRSVGTVPSPANYVATKHPTRIWIARGSESSAVAMEGPGLVGDTLVGWVDGAQRHIPLSRAIAVSARELSVPRTAALAVASSAVLAGLIVFTVDRSPTTSSGIAPICNCSADPKCAPAGC